MGQKADFVGTWTLNDAGVALCLEAANNRGQQCFNVMAPYGVTTSTPPLSLTTMAQAYVLDAAAVEAILADTGARGNEFLTAVSTYAAEGSSPATVTVIEAQGTPEQDAITRLGGAWEPGQQFTVTLTLFNDAGEEDVHSYTVRAPSRMTASMVAQIMARLMDASPLYHATYDGDEVRIRPEAMVHSVNIAVTPVTNG